VFFRPSQWEFVTDGGGGLSLALSAAGGYVVLKDPSGDEVTYRYGALGVGVSAGVKLRSKFGTATIPLVKTPVTGSLGFFPSGGAVYINEIGFAGEELSRSDIAGSCVILEGGGGLVLGATGDVILFGLDSTASLAAAAAPGGTTLLPYLVLALCRGVLLMGGVNLGLQASVGVTAYGGYLWLPVEETPEAAAADRRRASSRETIGHNF
jgi:hypothetical protein